MGAKRPESLVHYKLHNKLFHDWVDVKQEEIHDFNLRDKMSGLNFSDCIVEVLHRNLEHDS